MKIVDSIVEMLCAVALCVQIKNPLNANLPSKYTPAVVVPSNECTKSCLKRKKTHTFQSDILHNMCAYFEWNKLYVAAHSWIWVWFNIFYSTFQVFARWVHVFCSVVLHNIYIMLMNFLLLKHFRFGWIFWAYFGLNFGASIERERREKKRITQNARAHRMKFDDKLLPSENDLSQNEYKAAFVCVWPMYFHAQIKKHLCDCFRSAYCELMAPIWCCP